MKKFTLLLVLILSLGCANGPRQRYFSKAEYWELSALSAKELEMANELLAYGLEHEAIYTLLDTLKPISSLGASFSFPLAKSGEMKDGDKYVADIESDSVQMALTELESWNHIVNVLSNNDFQFLLIPYKQPWHGKRNLQILVCRRSQFDRLISEKAGFFGQWGFTEGANPAAVLTTIEFESRNDRYRAYGYLFGYPEHAVDFFVNASISEENTGEFVKRDFFSMPVAVGETGYFTYATPKEYVPTEVDSMIYKRAKNTLAKYIELKKNYTNESGKLNAVHLLLDYWKSGMFAQ